MPPHSSRSLKNLFYKGHDPEILRFPELDNSFETSIKGVYIIGDLTGIPLLKNAVNMGHSLVQKLLPTLKGEGVGKDEFHLIIVGAGGAGLAAALEAKNAGLKYVVLEQKIPGHTIHQFFKGKEIFAEPSSLPNKSRLWVEDSKKEELLEKWQEILEAEDLNVRCNLQVSNVKRDGANLVVETTQGELFRGARVVLAMGRSGNPRMLNVPGEDLPKVHHSFVDPEIHVARKVTIVGGGDTSLEVALALAPHNDVCLLVRAGSISRAQRKNVDRIESAVENDQLQLLTDTIVTEIRDDEIDIETNNEKSTIRNDHTYVLIGSTPSDSFLRRMKIRHVGDWSFRRIVYLMGFTLLIAFLYAWKKPLFWPFKIDGVPNPLLYGWTTFQPSMWFGILYSIVITGFGVRAIKRYRKDSYQVRRYLTLIFSQVVLFWLLPEIIFQTLMNVPDGWRSYGLFYPAPLYVWNFWAPGNAHVFWFVWTVALSLVGTPIIAALTGKKYCAYICSCGGLAETLGDAFRTLSPRGRKARAWENITTYFVLFFVAMVVVFGMMDSNSVWWDYQRVAVDFILAGVVGVAAYPFWGNRIWCRFLCPLAKLLYIFAKDNSKVKISPGAHCIRCTLCSKYCQMGIPVMEFAQNREEFSNVESSCIQCGICITVCPTRNLQHGDWSEEHWRQEIENGPPINVN